MATPDLHIEMSDFDILGPTDALTQYQTGLPRTVTNVVSGTGGVWRVATELAHNYVTGDQVTCFGAKGVTPIQGVVGTITVLNATTFEIDGSVYGGIGYVRQSTDNCVKTYPQSYFI